MRDYATVICEWTTLSAGGVCRFCNQRPLKRDYASPPRRMCTNIEQASPSLTDTIIRNGTETKVELFRPTCRHLQSRTEVRVKGGCGSNVFLPIYQCSLFKRCSPFGKVTDPGLIHPCQDCESYEKMP